jgi:hypothetical protein
MASTYSDLKIELIGTGEQTGTWGTTTNNNFSVAVGEAITGSADVAFSSADVTVTLTNTNASQAARNLRLNLTGTSGGARQLILGSGCQIEKLYLINNGLADAVTVKNTTGTGITVPAGKSMFVYNNGTNVVDAITYLSSIGTGVFDAGTVSAPSITFTGDTNTGIYSPAADTIGFTEGGVEGLRLNSNGQTSTSIAGTASLPSFTRTGDENTGIFFPAADTIAFTEGGVESMRIDSSANVGIGTASPTVRLDVYNSTSVEIAARSDTATIVSSNRYSTDGSAPSITCRKYRGTLASPTAVATGDNLGSFNFNAYGGTTLRNVAFIRGFVETYTSDANISSYLQFNTSPFGSAVGTEVMRIASTGDVGIGITNPNAYSKLAVLGAVTAGEQSSTGGSTLLRGYYPVGALTIMGTMFSSGGPVIGYGATGSTSVEGQFLSTTTANLPRSAMYMNGNSFIYYSAAAQTTAIGSAVTGMTERMRLDLNGNLGIGTSSPAARLDVVGAGGGGTQMIVSDGANQGRLQLSKSAAFYGFNAGADYGGIQFFSNGTEHMRIGTTGRVSIGTTVQVARLTVQNMSTTDSATIDLRGNRNFAAETFGATSLIAFSDGTRNAHDFGAIRFEQNPATSDGGGALVRLYAGGASSSFAANCEFLRGDARGNTNGVDNIQFRTQGIERMRIDLNGRVQIGAANPSSVIFSVQGGSGSGAVSYFGSSDANLTAMAVRNAPASNATMLSSEWSSTAVNLLFGIGGTERMRINTTGDVIVGDTDNRGAKFAVSRVGSDGNLLGLFSGDTGGGNSDGIVHTYGGASLANYRVKIYMNTYNGRIDMRDSGNTDTVRIAAAGACYLGVSQGVGNPLLFLGATSQTQVGTIDFFKNGNGAGSSGLMAFNASGTDNYPIIFRRNAVDIGYIQYSGTAVSYFTGSDYRLKENVAPMTGALNTVSKLKPVTYKWKVDGSAGQGFIAHELQAVMPDCVSGKKDEVDAEGKPKYQGVDTSFLVATLTAAIQEQQVMIEQLTTRLNALEGK